MAKKVKTSDETVSQLEAMFADEPETPETAVLAEAPEEGMTEGEDNVKPGRPPKYESTLRLRYRNAARNKARAQSGTWEVRGDDYWIIPAEGEPYLYTYVEFQVDYANKQATKALKLEEKAQSVQPEDQVELVTA